MHSRKLAKLLSLLLIFSSGWIHADEVTFWNSVTLKAIRVDRTSPPQAARALALVHAGIFDAVNAIDLKYNPYQVQVPINGEISASAAAASAAHTILVALFPAQAKVFDSIFQARLGCHADSAPVKEGVRVGIATGNYALGSRSEDDSGNTAPGPVPHEAPGVWRPTAPSHGAFLLPGWGSLSPWAMNGQDQFFAAQPPAVGSAPYEAALEEVKKLGAKFSFYRSPYQTRTAYFWMDGPGSVTLPGHWNEIAREIVENQAEKDDFSKIFASPWPAPPKPSPAVSESLALVETARLFALLNIGLVDASIAAWNNKWTYFYWRPITAIEASAKNRKWEPLLSTPASPSYISDYAMFSATAAQILQRYFGTDKVSFWARSEALPLELRFYSSLSQAAKEAGRSRVYAGVEFEFDNQAGLTAGKALGDYMFDNFLFLAPPPQP